MSDAHQPIHALTYPLAIDRRTSHDTPVAIPQLGQLQRLGDLARPLRAGLILFVREDEQGRLAQLVLVQHRRELVGRDFEPLDVGRVDDEDYGCGVGVVAAPVGADGGLAAKVLGLGWFG